MQHASNTLTIIARRLCKHQPGAQVRHVDDKFSFGMVLGTKDDSCWVLWSAPPVTDLLDIDLNIKTEYIQPTSRKLKAGWSVTEADDPVILGGFGK